ncbi:helix-turn-helix transcriptional regulator [Bifidobacterium simiiventris]|uniref:helix-turn-helix transcriptional regulator n=1 Tax=Bifidobacterium simiiventris TaxID=2834434 RepID=UPI001C5826FE|nr:helix-turn-helix transcriptional regulator [Bifidobacterium simiiventris]MBW3078032.1 helix-turn-helix transcriptional regulator [Bifidobacterium simiiventris]
MSTTKEESDGIYPQIGQALVRARKESGLTQDQLAERSRVSRITIARIENARINPSFKTLEALAHGMGRTLTIDFTPADDITD